MRALIGLWRWRHNPVCRGTDLAEAWVALVALFLIVVAAPLAGVVAGSMSRDALYRSVEEQRSMRHEVTATVVHKVAQPPLDPDPETSTARDAHTRVVATWKAPDGSTRQDRVVAALTTPHRGDKFTVWTDDQGRAVGRPSTGPPPPRTRRSPDSVRPSPSPAWWKAPGAWSCGACCAAGTRVGTAPGTSPDPTGAGPARAADRRPQARRSGQLPCSAHATVEPPFGRQSAGSSQGQRPARRAQLPA